MVTLHLSNVSCCSAGSSAALDGHIVRLVQPPFYLAIMTMSTAAAKASDTLLCCRYTVDAFAAAGTVLGSRLAAKTASSQEAKRFHLLVTAPS